MKKRKTSVKAVISILMKWTSRSVRKCEDNTAQNRSGDEDASLTKEGESQEQDSANDIEGHTLNIIDLTSDAELESEGCSTKKDSDLQSASKVQQIPQIKLETSSVESKKPTQPDEKPEKLVKPVKDLNSDSAPPLISAEDLSKLAAQNPTVADEPPILTKMNVPAHRVSNSLEDMISRLKTRVLTTQPSSSDSSLNGGDGPTQMDLEPSVGDALDKRSADKSPGSAENPFGITEPISDPSSPETENIESYPPSPSSFAFRCFKSGVV